MIGTYSITFITLEQDLCFVPLDSKSKKTCTMVAKEILLDISNDNKNFFWCRHIIFLTSYRKSVFFCEKWNSKIRFWFIEKRLDAVCGFWVTNVIFCSHKHQTVWWWSTFFVMFLDLDHLLLSTLSKGVDQKSGGFFGCLCVLYIAIAP